MELVREMKTEFASAGGAGSTIVYVQTRKETEGVATFLQAVSAELHGFVFVRRLSHHWCTIRYAWLTARRLQDLCLVVDRGL